MKTGNTASGTFYVFNKKEQSIPLVFIHGVGLTYEIWQPQLDFFKNYSNVSYDILGHGKSSLTKKNISFDDFSNQLLELINELKIDKILQNSQLKIIKDGKHLCGIECADEVNFAIKNFVENND